MEKVNLRIALGFGEKGYITIFKGDTDFYDDWFRKSPARYTVRWGWYIPSDVEVPNPLPVGIEPIVLKWDEIANGDILIPEEQLKEKINSLLYDKSSSEYIGAIGDRYADEVVVVSAYPYESQYGISTIHVFEDTRGNQLVWNTTAKQLAVGGCYILTGTIKDHRNFKNVHQTVLTRCKVEEI